MRSLLRRFGAWYSIRANGACPEGGAHEWRTVFDHGYGQDLICLKCWADGYMDEGC